MYTLSTLQENEYLQYSLSLRHITTRVVAKWGRNFQNTANHLDSMYQNTHTHIYIYIYIYAHIFAYTHTWKHNVTVPATNRNIHKNISCWYFSEMGKNQEIHMNSQ